MELGFVYQCRHKDLVRAGLMTRLLNAGLVEVRLPVIYTQDGVPFLVFNLGETKYNCLAVIK